MATAAELAGVAPPDNVDSISLVPTLVGDSSKQKQHEFLYWEFHEGGFKQAALYQGRWKGIRKGGPDTPVALFDQVNDVSESMDVASSNPAIAKTISDYLKSARSESIDWIPVW